MAKAKALNAKDAKGSAKDATGVVVIMRVRGVDA